MVKASARADPRLSDKCVCQTRQVTSAVRQMSLVSDKSACEWPSHSLPPSNTVHSPHPVLSTHSACRTRAICRSRPNPACQCDKAKALFRESMQTSSVSTTVQGSRATRCYWSSLSGLSLPRHLLWRKHKPQAPALMWTVKMRVADKVD